MRSRYRVFKGIFVMLCILLFSSSAMAKVNVAFSAPEGVRKGESFIISLRSSSELSEVRYKWKDSYFAPRPEYRGGTYESMAMLGTDCGDTSGKVYLIEIEGKAGDEPFRFSWQVRMLDRKYPTARLTVDKSMVTPPENVLSRIRRERDEVKRVLATKSPVRQWALPFERPLDGKVTSPFGEERVFNGVRHSRHGGADLRAKPGTPVKAAADGTVLLADNLYFAGGSIYVDHGNGVISMYFHLSGMKVKAGDSVKRGEVIGLSGSSGRVTGPHLHFGISVGGGMVDPLLLTGTDEEKLSAGNRNIRFSL